MYSDLKSLPFVGNSMRPLLKTGDNILFTDDVGVISKGTLLLFKDSLNGEFIVHRVLNLNPLETKGDWSCQKEKVSRDNVFGKVVGFERDGKRTLFTGKNIPLSSYLYFSKILLSQYAFVRKPARAMLYLLSSFLITDGES